MSEPSTTRPAPSRAVALVERVRRRARAALVGAAWLRAVTLVLAVVLLLGALDYLFRLPRAVRVIHLLALAWGLFELWRRSLLPAIRFRPGLAEIARRVGQAAGGGADRLASGVELARPGSDGAAELTAALARATAQDADEFVQAMRGRRFVRRRGIARAAGLLLLVLVIAGGSAATRPDLARIGLARTLWPLGAAQWPKRTALADATTPRVHPIGEALQLRVLLTRTHLPQGKSDVAALYRIVVDGKPGPTERAMLTSQNRLASTDDGQTGELFERLIEPAATIDDNTPAAIEYWFEADDSRTEPRRIDLAARPRVEEIIASVQPPAYAREIAGSFLQTENLELTPDGSGVAQVQQVLSGSAIRLELALSKPAFRLGADTPGWTQPDPRSLVYETTADTRSRVEVALVDQAGLESPAPVAIVLDVTTDAPAGVAILEPAYDEAVLATAFIGLEAEGRDDFGMRWLALERQNARAPEGSEGGAPEPLAGPVVIGRVDSATPAPELRLDSTIDLATIGVRAGDEVWLTAAGRDVYAAAQGDTDERVTRSAVRRLRVIDESTFVNQIRGELAGVRRAAIEIDTEQARIADAPNAADTDPTELADRQRAVTERLDAQRRALETLTRRADRNALGDETLTGMLEDAEALLRDATNSSDDAADALDPGDNQRADEPAAEEAQEQVRDDLNTLIGMLDQGQDNWVARRTIESLLDDQRALARETEELGDRTMGQSRSQLSPEDLTELERIAARQREAAERAEQALDSLTDRAEALERVDSAQAQAMSRAARRGRQERLDEQMRQAAAEVTSNQTRAAAQGQQAAMDALEQMLDDIDSAEANRDESLRRVLADVLDSLEALITEQESQIDALNYVRDEAELVALAQPMVALATNTLGLLDQIGSQQDLATIASLVTRAADAQERAVGSLRDASIDSAAEAEDESLALLRQARDEAERMDEQAEDRENARKRNELRRAYRDLLELQVAVAEDTLPWLDAEIDRRARAQVRGLGQRQQAITETLAEIRRNTDELADAAVFDLAHRRLDRASESAGETLLEGQATATVSRNQATVTRVLRSLIEALAEQQQSQQFGDQGSSGGGGGAAGGNQDQPIIPELAELKLLRAMQAEAMEWTRNLDEAAQRPGDDEVAELADLQQELAERAEILIEKLTQSQDPGPGPVPGGQP